MKNKIAPMITILVSVCYIVTVLYVYHNNPRNLNGLDFAGQLFTYCFPGFYVWAFGVLWLFERSKMNV